MSSPPAPPVARAPTSQPVLPDEILEHIFLRLDAAADLARASVACTTFRRVVSARRFLRRFHSLHPPPLLGFLESYESDRPGAFHPADPPHRSAPAALALALAADFSFSFIPNPTPSMWNVCDARDGRVLLCRANITLAFADLVVCDPLHCRYVQLPPIPDDLAAVTGILRFQPSDAFLDPATDKEKEDLSFRVICAVQCRHKLVIFYFPSVMGKWCGITFNRSTPLLHCGELLERHYAHGCFYWAFPEMGTLYVLDTREMKFSVVDAPPSGDSVHQTWVIVEAGEGRLGIVHVVYDNLELYSKTLGNKKNGADVEEWKYDKMIPLPQMDFFWRILGAAEGHLILQGTPWNSLLTCNRESHYFTLDVKTLMVERLCVSNRDVICARLYANFPPSLSLPSI